jgi:hypothetical protein
VRWGTESVLIGNLMYFRKHAGRDLDFDMNGP